jgi:hypothetical protein
MKIYLVITLSVLGLILTGISLVGAEELYGIWKNEDYNKADTEWGTTRFAKLVFNQEGTLAIYNNTTTKTKSLMGPFEITEKWTDTDGNIWYKLSTSLKGASSAEPYYWTVSISNSGKTLEYGFSGSDYPNEKDLKNAYYHGFLDHE